MRIRSALLTAILPAMALPAQAKSETVPCAIVEELASYPSPSFLENLYVEPSGRVLFTSYLAQQILTYRPDGSAVTFASLDAFPISILPLGPGWLVAAHGEPFTAGPAFTASNHFLVLDQDGNLIRKLPAPEARFLNGMTQLSDGSVLAADSILGRIWRLDPVSGALTVWLDDPSLSADPAGKDIRPGANGLKLHSGELFFSNSFTGRIHAVNLGNADIPSGPPRLVAEPGKVDDFVIASDGSIFLATHSDTVLRADPEGKLEIVLPSGGDGSTAVAFASEEQTSLYALTTGGLLEGAGRPARLLKIQLPGGDKLCAEK